MRPNKKVKIDWGLVLQEIDQALKYFDNQGVKPTLRTLFYYLYSKKLISNTRSAYKGLSRVLVKARKDCRYPWDFLEDRSRTSIGFLDDEIYQEDEMELFKEDLEDKLENIDLESLIDNYFDYTEPGFIVGKWSKQSIVVEIWIEKEALATTIRNWIWDKDVPIMINKGYSSWTFIYNNVQSLKDKLDRHDRVHIYYLGDLDYSGMDIQRFLEESLEYFGLDKDIVQLERLALTPEQVEKFKLPPRPEDSETIQKLNRDSRKNNYDLKYIVELDSLLAYVPSEFKNLILDAIDSKWNKSIYDNLKEKQGNLRDESYEFIEKMKKKARETMGVIDED